MQEENKVRQRGDLVKEKIRELLGLEEDDCNTLDKARMQLQYFLKEYDFDYPANRDIILLTKLACEFKGVNSQTFTNGFVKDLLLPDGDEDVDEDLQSRLEKQKKKEYEQKYQSTKKARALKKGKVTVNLEEKEFQDRIDAIIKRITKKLNDKNIDVDVTLHKTSCVFSIGKANSNQTLYPVFSFNTLRFNYDTSKLTGTLQFNKVYIENSQASRELVEIIKERLPSVNERDWKHAWIKMNKVLAIKNAESKDVEKYIEKISPIFV